MNSGPAINEAIVQYIGYQCGFSFPQSRGDQVRTTFGEGADELLAVIENCLRDLGVFETRWGKESLNEAWPHDFEADYVSIARGSMNRR